MNWSAKDGVRSSLYYGGEGVPIHLSYQGVCRQHGKEDKYVTHGDLVLSSKGSKVAYKVNTEMDTDAMQGVGEPNSTLTIVKQKR